FNMCGTFVEQFFEGTLDFDSYPELGELKELRVSSHLYIRRSGEIIQFVPFHQRAWHAGVSQFQGKDNCNDFSIGIELAGADQIPYTGVQYQSLARVTKVIQAEFPLIHNSNIVGHSDIAPGRKTDPGDSFNWSRYKGLLE
ncbi:MAG: 1,6-anhydro-N-acetylmuramyl-L-alanine amidase AmpD, partial [Kangiellaceae bacterium]|nr:1,6-anhydro-N-acetylmuramyl-L-alanine amidase AmpD [Kangiellaceae bacterium]